MVLKSLILVKSKNEALWEGPVPKVNKGEEYRKLNFPKIQRSLTRIHQLN